MANDRPRSTRRPARLRPTLLAGLLAATAFSPAPAGEKAPEVLALSSDLQVRVVRGREIVLEMVASPADDWAAIAARACGDPLAAAALAALAAPDATNGGRALEPGDAIRVPLALLAPDYRALVLRNVFPRDHRDGGDWVHVAQGGALATYDEGLWQVAEWFTGDGRNFLELMQANRLGSPELRQGQRVRVPEALLHAAFRPRLSSDDGLLEYESDAAGPYAVYRLQPGEALYSAVVVRFTGRTGSADVSAVAEQLRERNGIRDLRDIPASFSIKIPMDLVEPEYLPAGHPRRVAAEARREELARELARQPVHVRGGLEGVLVILDPGHGGRDLGTMNNGVWEHDYVYDVTCRLKDKLERATAARVVLTLEDRETGCTPSSTDALEANQQGTVLTDPPFLAREKGEARIGVNLRWYLANSVYRRALDEGYAPERVIFVSLHADARHPSLRGVMVYVPGAEYVTRTYGHTSNPYPRYREVREQPHVRFSKSQRIRSEALSRSYADAVVAAFEAEGLPVQPYQPVRDRIIRGRQRFVPAVLRGNVVPSKVLVEMVNLSNTGDAKLLAAAAERDRLARGLVRSLLSFYGEEATPPSRQAGLATSAR